MTAASNKIHQSDRIEKKFDSIVPADGIIEKGKKKAFSPLPFPVIGQLPSNRITTNYLSIPADRFPKISFRSGGNRFSYPKIPPPPKLDHLETLGRVLAGFPHPPPSSVHSALPQSPSIRIHRRPILFPRASDRLFPLLSPDHLARAAVSNEGRNRNGGGGGGGGRRDASRQRFILFPGYGVANPIKDVPTGGRRCVLSDQAAAAAAAHAGQVRLG